MADTAIQEKNVAVKESEPLFGKKERALITDPLNEIIR